MVQTVAAELDADPTKLELIPRLAVSDATLHNIARLLITELRQGGIGTALMLDCAARSIALHLLRRHSNVASPAPKMRPVLGRRLDRAIDFMRERMEAPIRLADLAEACELSPAHFGRTFKDATGKSPHTFLTDLRLERAQDLLAHSRLPIAEIADRCGFFQAQYFSTIFRQKVGVTPSAWRAAKR